MQTDNNTVKHQNFRPQYPKPFTLNPFSQNA
jgi:hypothetical protein